MASTKNVQALNNRLDLACKNRIDEFYRQHISSMAVLEHEKLDTARLLQSVKKCPSNFEPLSIKFLGPPPPSRQHHVKHQRRTRDQSQGAKQPQQKPKQKKEQDAAATDNEDNARQQFRQPPLTALPVSDNPFAPPPSYFIPGMPPPAEAPLERSKTIAVVEVRDAANDAARESRSQLEKQRRRRVKTPFPNKLEKFYDYLEGTKRACGLSVIDSTQTPEARQFRGTLTRADWLVKLAKLDPEFFKNIEDSADSSSGETDY